jgi:hypothetical protein
MATYSAYFDESTGNKSPILVVAGFLSTDAKWMMFEREWREVLAEFKIIAFHAQHFAMRKGEFLDMEEAVRQSLYGKLLRIIQQRTMLGFATVMHCKEFSRVFKGNDRRDIGSMYNICCTACHLEVGEWAQKNYQIEPIAYFFDAGNKNTGEVSKTFLETQKRPENIGYRMGTIAFEDDEFVIPLQAADIAAYELWKWLDEHFADKIRHGRFPLQELIEIPWTIREFDGPILEEMLEHRKTGKTKKKVSHHVIRAFRPGRIWDPSSPEE